MSEGHGRDDEASTSSWTSCSSGGPRSDLTNSTWFETVEQGRQQPTAPQASHWQSHGQGEYPELAAPITFNFFDGGTRTFYQGGGQPGSAYPQGMDRDECRRTIDEHKPSSGPVFTQCQKWIWKREKGGPRSDTPPSKQKKIKVQCGHDLWKSYSVDHRQSIRETGFCKHHASTDEGMEFRRLWHGSAR